MADRGSSASRTSGVNRNPEAAESSIWGSPQGSHPHHRGHNTPIRLERDLNARYLSEAELIDGMVDRLKSHMVKAAFADVADEHARAQADKFDEVDVIY